MRKIFFVLLATAISVCSRAQSTSICVQPNCPVTIQLPLDSATIFAVVNLQGDTVSSYSWKAASLGTILTPTAAGTWVRGLTAPGTYTYSCMATTKHGSVLNVQSVITVLAALPAPRTVVSLQVYLLGQWVTIPVGQGLATMGLSDGSTQKY